METAVLLSGVVKSFGAHRAVDGLSIEVDRGTIFGLLGRNGAGKTTTIRMIMDILRPDAGRVEVLGRTLDDETKNRVGYLPEERGLYPRMKVRDMLAFQGAVKGLPSKESQRRAAHWIERVSLEEWAAKKVEELSKGMQQKVQFAAAVIGDPELLILDEPFSGMDPVNQDLFRGLILELNRAGCTIIFSTHVMDSAERLCDKIALIDHGKAVLDGTLGSIKERFGTNTVRLEFEGDGSFLRELPFVEELNDFHRYVELTLAREADDQELLRAVQERLRVRRFEVVQPSLHAIFVQQVGEESSDG